MRSIFSWIVALVGVSAAVAVSYRWLDRPIALWVHGDIGNAGGSVAQQFGPYPDPLVPLAVVFFLVSGLRVIMRRSLSGRLQSGAFVCAVSVLITETIKDEFKFVFGRTPPESWGGDYPSFIRDGVYGFHFIHGGPGYQSFPSGHMAAACAAAAVLWCWYPRLRWCYVIAVAAVGLVLIGTNAHFLSDVIGGAFLGAFVGWMVTTIWKEFVPATGRASK